MDRLIEAFRSAVISVYSLTANGFDAVNHLPLLAIALILALLMKMWRELWMAAVIGVVLKQMIDIGTAFAQHSEARLPNILSPALLLHLVAEYLGFIVVISLFFAIRKLFRGGALSRA